MSTNADAGREHSAHEQPDRDGDLKPGILLREEDAGVPMACRPRKPPGGHEGEREQQDARVASPIGRLAGRVAEHERDAADDPEDDEVRPIVLEVRVELRPEQQRDEPDERERGDQECGGDARNQPGVRVTATAETVRKVRLSSPVLLPLERRSLPCFAHPKRG